MEGLILVALITTVIAVFVMALLGTSVSYHLHQSLKGGPGSELAKIMFGSQLGFAVARGLVLLVALGIVLDIEDANDGLYLLYIVSEIVIVTAGVWAAYRASKLGA